MIILDGELLPWTALGQQLVDSHFRVIDKTLTSELQLLKESGFEQALDALKSSEAFSLYAKKSSTVSKKDLQNEFGQANISTFSSLQDYMKIGRRLDDKLADISTYHAQVEIFGVDAPLSYVAFDILKIIKNDGTEVVKFGDARNYALLNTNRDLVIDITTPGANQKVQEFFDKLTKEDNMEGIVIKPIWEGQRRPWNVAPYMKVRNERYLTLIYGYDYKSSTKYDKLIAKKGIKSKLKASMQDESIGRKMLEVPFSAINLKNEEYKKLIASFLFEEEKQSSIDPRL